MRRFGGGNRAEKKETIIEKIKKFFEKYLGIWSSNSNSKDIVYDIKDDDTEKLGMVAEEEEKYKYI